MIEVVAPNLVTLVVVGEELWHSIYLCEDFNKQLGLVCRDRRVNIRLLILDRQ